MALTLDEALPRLQGRLQAARGTGRGAEGAIWDTLALTVIDGEEGVGALRGVAKAIVEELGVSVTELNVQMTMAALLTVLLAGYEVGCSVGDDG